jgi:hypothetical protein
MGDVLKELAAVWSVVIIALLGIALVAMLVLFGGWVYDWIRWRTMERYAPWREYPPEVAATLPGAVWESLTEHCPTRENGMAAAWLVRARTCRSLGAAWDKEAS